MFIQTWFYNDRISIEIDGTMLENVPHYRAGTLAERVNQHGKVSVTASGWACSFPDEHKSVIANWLLTVPNDCFTHH